LPEPTSERAADSAPPARTAVLLVNLGTPAAPETGAVRRYLAQFLSDPRVVELPRPLWLPILHGIVLRTRPAASAAKYRSIWTPQGSPLAVWTATQAQALAAALRGAGHDVVVRHAMRYGEPAIGTEMDRLMQAGVTRVLMLPLYPQYAAATTGSAVDALSRWATRARHVPALRSAGDYHADPAYIDALAASLHSHWQRQPPAERLLLSFHGLPARSSALGDPYERQCQATARLLRERLQLAPERLLVTVQSRFGKARWIEPYTEPSLRALAAQGVRSVDVMCPGFAADCLETLEEIAQEGRAAFIAAGGQDFRYVPCLNDSPHWLQALTALALRELAGWI
jgi:ferrochelatase